MAVILVVRFMTDFIMRGTEEEEEEGGAWFRLTPPPAPPPALVLGMPMLLVRLSRWYSVITPDSAPTATKLLLLLLLLPLLLLLLPVVCFFIVREPCSWACRLGGGGGKPGMTGRTEQGKRQGTEAEQGKGQEKGQGKGKGKGKMVET